jgi:hypothetical protein
VSEIFDEFVERHRAPVRERRFEVIPDLLVGIEFRSAGREAVDVESRMSSEELPNELAAMNRAAVPHQYAAAR